MSATAVNERPILFSGQMVRAILDGTKTQTRRVVKGEWADSLTREVVANEARRLQASCDCPYGQPGDRLWVRETFHSCPHCVERGVVPCGVPLYRADPDDRPLNPKCAAHAWRPSIFMPRWASRLTLEITEVRVERVQDISYADVIEEGCPSPAHTLASPEDHDWYIRLWDSLNARRGYSWESNPYVWALTFRRVHGSGQ